VGIEHFMQALVLYFVRKYKSEMGKYAQTFMKKMVDENILSEKFLIDWADKTTRLDKDSALYDKKAEKKFRENNEKFMEWLKKTEYVEASGDEAEAEGVSTDPTEEAKVPGTTGDGQDDEEDDEEADEKAKGPVEETP